MTLSRCWSLLWRWRTSLSLTPLLLAVLVALFLLGFANWELWHRAYALLYPEAQAFSLVILALMLVLLFAGVIYLLLWPWLAKPLLVLLFICAALGAYAMDAYGTLIDANMVGNLVATNWRELQGLLNWQLCEYLLLLGVLPSLVVCYLPLKFGRCWQQLLFKPLVLGVTLLLASGLLLANYQQLSSIGRNHRNLRYLINPWLPLYYGYSYWRDQHLAEMPFQVVGQDAKITPPLPQAHKPLLIFLVVGETARAQDFSLNGYERNTNPQLSKRDVISFRDVHSCGTETAVSVPCMFSPYTRESYSLGAALHTSNLLDVARQAGVSVFWRDNNSGSKGMAARVAYEDVSRSHDAANCAPDHEHCYDGVLLYQLPAWLAKQRAAGQQYLLVVLHMYGSHGPAYYKRYPADFARFTPECRTNALGDCSAAAIVNSYDNSILYTDAVLARMIDFLRRQQGYDSAMLYLSDHGESLGENGIYLHGMPWHLAPEQQKHIPLIWWMSPGYAKLAGLSASCLAQRVDEPLSQDYLFSSVLGMFNIRSSVYDAALDFLAPCRGGSKTRLTQVEEQ